MRVLQPLALVSAAAVLLAGCSLDYIAPELLPDPARPSDAPRVAAYYSPTDQRVLYMDSERVELAPVISPR